MATRSDVVVGHRYKMLAGCANDALAPGTLVEVWGFDRGPGIQVMRVADIEAHPVAVTVYRVAAAALDPVLA